MLGIQVIDLNSNNSLVVSLPLSESPHDESTIRYSSQYNNKIWKNFRWLNYLVCFNDIWLFENEYYLLSGELQQVDPVVLEHEESLLHLTWRSRVFSHLRRMMHTSNNTWGPTVQVILVYEVCILLLLNLLSLVSFPLFVLSFDYSCFHV